MAQDEPERMGLTADQQGALTRLGGLLLDRLRKQRVEQASIHMLLEPGEVETCLGQSGDPLEATDFLVDAMRSWRLALIQPHPDFFQVGESYVDNRPFAAPEQLRLFQCRLVDTHPRTGQLVAFGFGRVGVSDQHSGDWHRVSLDQGDWTTGDGWVRLNPDLTTERPVVKDPAEGVA